MSSSPPAKEPAKNDQVRYPGVPRWSDALSAHDLLVYVEKRQSALAKLHKKVDASAEATSDATPPAAATVSGSPPSKKQQTEDGSSGQHPDRSAGTRASVDDDNKGDSSKETSAAPPVSEPDSAADANADRMDTSTPHPTTDEAKDSSADSTDVANQENAARQEDVTPGKAIEDDHDKKAAIFAENENVDAAATATDTVSGQVEDDKNIKEEVSAENVSPDATAHASPGRAKDTEETNQSISDKKEDVDATTTESDDVPRDATAPGPEGSSASEKMDQQQEDGAEPENQQDPSVGDDEEVGPTPEDLADALRRIRFLIGGDITRLQVDAIVNAANSRLQAGGGVCGAIHFAAGGSLQKELFGLYPDGCETGGAVIAGAHNLAKHGVKNTIHAVGPIYDRRDPKGSAELLWSAYESSLSVLHENDLHSIAFPCISTGIYGYDNRAAAELIMSRLPRFLALPDFKEVHVVLCLFLKVDRITYAERLLLEYSRLFNISLPKLNSDAFDKLAEESVQHTLDETKKTFLAAQKSSGES